MQMPSQPSVASARRNSSGNSPSRSRASQYSSPKRAQIFSTASRSDCCSSERAKSMAAAPFRSPHEATCGEQPGNSRIRSPDFAPLIRLRSFKSLFTTSGYEALRIAAMVPAQRARDGEGSREGYAALGLSLYMSRRFDEALAIYDAGLCIAPGDAALHNGRGVVLLELRRPAEARDEFVRALAADPDCLDALG